MLLLRLPLPLPFATFMVLGAHGSLVPCGLAVSGKGQRKGVPGRTNLPLVTVLFGLMEVATPDLLGLPSVKSAIPGMESNSETVPPSSFHRSSAARSQDGEVWRQK